MEAVTIFKEFVHRVVSLGNLPGPRNIRFYLLRLMISRFFTGISYAIFRYSRSGQSHSYFDILSLKTDEHAKLISNNIYFELEEIVDS